MIAITRALAARDYFASGIRHSGQLVEREKQEILYWFLDALKPPLAV
jgi:hypothetical protein